MLTSLGLSFLSVAYFSKIFKHVCVAFVVFLFFFFIFFELLNNNYFGPISKPGVSHFVFKFGTFQLFPWQLLHCTL